jgi:dTDP-6-deoxy-L-talose 4-dehydrogenase (NAD+)
VLSIDAKLNPKFLYSACKASVYFILEQIFKNKIEFLWCRLFFLYGPGEHKNRLFACLHENLKNSKQALLTDGVQVRDYLDVRLAAKDLVSLAFSNKKGVFNICSGVGQSIRHFAQKIADQYGKQELLIFGAIPNKSDDPKEIVGVKNY